MSTPADQVQIDPALLKQFAAQEGALSSDVSDYGDLAKRAEAGAGESFSQPQPEQNTGIMSTAPYLIALTALGGKAAGVHATTMLGATNGMMQGLIKGSQQRYQDEKKKYDDAYQKWLDKWTQQQKLYTEMRQVYKGRIDADVKALEMTFKMMGMNEKVDMDTFKKFIQAGTYADKLKNTNEKIDHDRNIEQLKRQEFEQKKQAADGAKLSPEDLKFAAQQYLAGDKSVFTGLGRGAQGSANIVALRQAVREQAQSQGLSGSDVAAKMAEFNAIMAEERKIGGIAGGVEFSSAELSKFIPLAEKASAAVPRGQFVPYNRLVQMGAANLSDPNLKKLYVNTQGVLNAYDVLASRGGTDKDKREQTRQMLTTADSPEAYKAALDAMQQELQVAREAGKQAKDQVADELRPPGSPAAPPPAGPPTFASEQEASQAAAAGKLKPGDPVVVNGVRGTWQ